VHQYFDNHKNDLPTFLGSSLSMDRFIDTVVATCDFVQAKKRGKKPIHLSFDEWNVWFHSNEADSKLSPWTVGPAQLEDVYTFEDALVVGTLINTLLRHADRVKIACMAQLVNVIAPIMTRNGGDAWRQTIYWPLYHASKYGRGTSLNVKVDVGCYDNAAYGDVPWVDTSAVLSEDGQSLTVFAVNRHQTQAATLDTSFAGLEHLKLKGHTVLVNPDIKAVNDEKHPDRVSPTEAKLPGVGNPVVLPALSWNVLRFGA